LFWGECSCGACFCAFGGGFFEALGYRTVEGDCHSDVETSAYEGESEFFAFSGGDLNAESAVNALAGLVDQVRLLGLPCEETAIALVSGRPGVVFA